MQAKLAGLDEKFRVLNNEPLADALKVRLETLDKRAHRWRPEILFLLLCLSDRPVENSRIEDLSLSRPSETTHSLTWADIISDDPLTEDSIWDEPDYGDDSSEDALSLSGEESPGIIHDTPSSTIAEDDVSTIATRHIVELDYTGLEAVEKSQFWRQPLLTREYSEDIQDQRTTRRITELQAIRECIFMLFGLPTQLFIYGPKNASIRYNTEYSIEHISPITLEHVLNDFANIGFALNELRQWTETKFSVPLVQTFHYTVECRLQRFQKGSGRIEQRFVAPSNLVVVSLQAVLSEIQMDSSCLLELAALVPHVPPETHGPHHSCLELLYNYACDSQTVGKMESFRYFAQMFFECLQTYLRLVRRWMEEGEIDSDDRTFFVHLANRDCDVSSLWHERYGLRKLPSGSVHGPRFVQTTARMIFNAGKSVTFLKAVGSYEEPEQENNKHQLSYESVCGEDALLCIAPFAEAFPIAFEEWVKRHYHSSSSRLHVQLDQKYGLRKTLDILEYLYFSRDGAVFQNFALGIFDLLERGKDGGNDQFVLTDLARTTFGNVPGLDAQRLKIRTRSGREEKVRRDSIESDFGTYIIDYAYPWPVANIIRSSTLKTYQRVFALLLRLLHAKFSLLRIKYSTTTAVNCGTKLTLSLRHQLLWFVDTVHAYITGTVLATSTAEMRVRLATAEDIDAMTKVHQEYIKHLSAQCLLTSNLEPILQAVRSMLNLCSTFSQAQNAEATKLTLADSRASFGSLLDHYPRGGNILSQATQDRGQDQDSDESDMGNDDDEDIIEDAGRDQRIPYLERTRQMLEQFNELHRFITAGLRGISRAGGEASWEVLAERLEWK